jgi:hypothetical protein
VAYYWDDTVKHDRPLITNCFVPGLAHAAGLHPSSATEERDLDMLLTNIALANQEERPLSYSRHRGHEYRGITLGRVHSCVGTVLNAGLALERRTKPGHRGWQSDLRATPALTEIFEDHNQQPVYGPRDPIILRSRRNTRTLLPLKPMRDRTRQVERFNEMLSGVRLGLDMTGALKLRNNLWLFERLDEDGFGNPRVRRQKLRLDRMCGHRVFTTDTEHHGRFYCPAQNIPSDARLMMTMNGEPVVELDFPSMHVALAYHLCGARLDGDAYGIEGFTRKQAKLGMLTAFNATKPDKAVASLTDARPGRQVLSNRKDAAILIEALTERHAPITSMLCSDAGMVLMNLDSRIMLTAVDRLLAKGISCTPIHDSLLVPERREGEAHEAMNFGWSEVLGKTRDQNLSITHCSIEKKQQKVSHSGGAIGSGPPDIPEPLEALFGDDGWWSSVLEEARLDVAEWTA